MPHWGQLPSTPGGDYVSPLVVTEGSITGTAIVSVLGAQYLCSGTTTNYTVTLPAAAGLAGKMLAFRMSNALTKLVTIKGNGAELIDGSNTRVMWAGESCHLYCDGTGWCKVGGKSIPFVGAMHLAAAGQNITTATMTKALLSIADVNSGPALLDTANSQCVLQRTGIYRTTAQAIFVAMTATTYLIDVFLNGASIYEAQPGAVSAGSRTAAANLMNGLAAGDLIDMRVFQNSGGTVQLFGDATKLYTGMQIEELAPW